MLKRLRSLAGRLRCDERGSAVPLFGLGILVVFGFGALAIDGSRLYATQNALTVTADAAALASVRDLPDAAAAVATPPVYGSLRHRFADRKLQGGAGWMRLLGWV